MHVKPVRVVVTANDERGRSYAQSDGPAGPAYSQAKRPTALTDIWHLNQVPADLLSDGTRHDQESFTLQPPPAGVSFRIVQFDPTTAAQRAQVDPREIFASMNAGGAHVDGAASPYMHRTETVDFGLVLQGSITMVLDQEELEVSAGDIVIQRGTNHAWENRGLGTAIVAFVLVDASRQ